MVGSTDFKRIRTSKSGQVAEDLQAFKPQTHEAMSQAGILLLLYALPENP